MENYCANKGKAIPLRHEVEAPIISIQPAHEGGEVVSRTHGSPLLPRR